MSKNKVISNHDWKVFMCEWGEGFSLSHRLIPSQYLSMIQIFSAAPVPSTNSILNYSSILYFPVSFTIISRCIYLSISTSYGTDLTPYQYSHISLSSRLFLICNTAFIFLSQSISSPNLGTTSPAFFGWFLFHLCSILSWSRFTIPGLYTNLFFILESSWIRFEIMRSLPTALIMYF